MGADRMPRVFLSYAREDVETARKLAGVLAEAGQTVWWDRHVHGGANFSKHRRRRCYSESRLVCEPPSGGLRRSWARSGARRTVITRNPVICDPSRKVVRMDADPTAQPVSTQLAPLDGAADRQVLESHLRSGLLHRQKGRGSHATIRY